MPHGFSRRPLSCPAKRFGAIRVLAPLPQTRRSRQSRLYYGLPDQADQRQQEREDAAAVPRRRPGEGSRHALEAAAAVPAVLACGRSRARPRRAARCGGTRGRAGAALVAPRLGRNASGGSGISRRPRPFRDRERERAREDGRASVLRTPGRQRPRLRDLSPAGGRHESFRGDHPSAVGGDRRPRPAVRGHRRQQLPEPAARRARLAFAAARPRAVPRVPALAPARRRWQADHARIRNRGRARPDGLQHRSGLRPSQPAPDDLGLSPSASRHESALRDLGPVRRLGHRRQERGARAHRSRDRETGQHEHDGGRARRDPQGAGAVGGAHAPAAHRAADRAAARCDRGVRTPALRGADRVRRRRPARRAERAPGARSGGYGTRARRRARQQHDELRLSARRRSGRHCPPAPTLHRPSATLSASRSRAATTSSSFGRSGSAIRCSSTPSGSAIRSSARARRATACT